ncbi:MAG: DUF2914 domain-containing protein [Candidatus Adlerbacteria bacterium]|nr:DUF2914 domain-containing protein [Candidatus Adlerbacteria bacterium]
MARLNRLVELWSRYEKRLAAVTVLCGFTFDLILAKRPDSIPDNILLLFYLSTAATIIIFLNRRSMEEATGDKKVEPLFLLLVLQFCFGGLASNLLILYGKSGSFGGSVFFLALLVCLLVGNELLKSRYAQLRFNIAVYYFLLLTYIVIALPTFVLHTIGTSTFLISTAVSLAVMAGVLSLLRIFALRGPDKKRQLWEMRAVIVAIFVVFNIFYFLNVIPPVPLSLKSAGIYHSVTRTSTGDYAGVYEKKKWYEFWRDTADTYTAAVGSPAYCFSAVFAPGDLSTPVVHVWEYFDVPSNNWQQISRVQFPINGGRAEGYRGFSITEALVPGQWRCMVETTKGQIIGSITFTAVISSSTPALSTTTL